MTSNVVSRRKIAQMDECKYPRFSKQRVVQLLSNRIFATREGTAHVVCPEPSVANIKGFARSFSSSCSSSPSSPPATTP
ncbi:hypothetical protein VN97_g2351 [Penicillium thymicola]|uniref:Uncharacterized protein n=1 Tax=Penicillium thymicola TaxID=293382 RepID=A0AAI9XBI6_PENTH|nr:hypothetical protein VN97_g2351 [Penicillium thymicola]